MTAHLTADQTLASVIVRHGLGRRSRSIVGTADAIVGLHTTSPVTPYLSLHARVPGFDRRDLDAAMWEAWELVRFRAMRLTMFVFPLELLEIAAAATRRIGETLAARWLRDADLEPSEFERLADAVDEALADGPRSVRELRRILGVPREVDLPGVVGRMCDVGRVVGGAPPRAWRSPVRVYHRWVDVLPDVDRDRWDEAPALRELIRRYVSTYGPVTVRDIAWWTGIAKGRCMSVLESLGDCIEDVAVEGWPGPLYRLREHTDATDPDDAVAALPLLDPYVQGYRDRTRFLPAGRHDFVYDGGGNATATIVHRGRIIGVWQIADAPSAAVRYHLFERVPTPVRKSAEANLAAAGALYFDLAVDVTEVREMAPLGAGGGRSAAHPLDGIPHRPTRKAAD